VSLYKSGDGQIDEVRGVCYKRDINVCSGDLSQSAFFPKVSRGSAMFDRAMAADRTRMYLQQSVRMLNGVPQMRLDR
jgi:hypothetical protein